MSQVQWLWESAGGACSLPSEATWSAESPKVFPSALCKISVVCGTAAVTRWANWSPVKKADAPALCKVCPISSWGLGIHTQDSSYSTTAVPTNSRYCARMFSVCSWRLWMGFGSLAAFKFRPMSLPKKVRMAGGDVFSPDKASQYLGSEFSSCKALSTVTLSFGNTSPRSCCKSAISIFRPKFVINLTLWGRWDGYGK